MTTTVTLIPGDGIGPEVTSATVRVLEVAGADLTWDRQIAGLEALSQGKEPLPDELLDSVRRNGVALKGPVTTPVGGGFQSVNVQLRKRLDLYANLRPVRSLEGIPGRFDNVDLIVVRENTEGLYSGLEHEVVPGVVESLKVITKKASMAIARFAFEHARSHGRKRITAVIQGEHHEDGRRSLPPLLSRRGQGLSGDRSRRPDHRRAVHAVGDVPRAL